jgi:hypothetical protein
MHWSSFYIVHHVWFQQQITNTKSQKKKKTEETKQTSESDSNIPGMLDLPDQEFKICLLWQGL